MKTSVKSSGFLSHPPRTPLGGSISIADSVQGEQRTGKNAAENHLSVFFPELLRDASDRIMKLTNRTVRMCGILVGTVTVATLLLTRVNDRLTVHLVDWHKNPVSASVIVQETRLFPMLGSMNFLPQWARKSTTSNNVNIADGILKARRVNRPGNQTVLIVRAKTEPSEFLIYLIGKTNGANLYRWPDKPRPPRIRIDRDGIRHEEYMLGGPAEWERISREQTDVSVILD